MIDKVTASQVEKLVRNLGLTTVIYETLMEDISKYFYLGVDNLESLIQINLGTVNPDVLSFLREYNFNLVKDMNEELALKLRDSIQRNLISGDKKSMVSDIKNIFDTTETRAKAIARTETARAYSVGGFTAAKEAEAKGIAVRKYWLPVLDTRTSPLCRRLGRKYSRENAIKIDAFFIDDESGFRGLTNPAHVNCRSDVSYIRY